MINCLVPWNYEIVLPNLFRFQPIQILKIQTISDWLRSGTKSLISYFSISKIPIELYSVIMPQYTICHLIKFYSLKQTPLPSLITCFWFTVNTKLQFLAIYVVWKAERDWFDFVMIRDFPSPPSNATPMRLRWLVIWLRKLGWLSSESEVWVWHGDSHLIEQLVSWCISHS